MKRPAIGLVRTMLLASGVCSGQSLQPPADFQHYIQIKLPPEAVSEGFLGRYTLADDDLGGWIQGRAGVSLYIVSTMHEGRQGTRIKAILYAPGCAMRILDFPLSASNNQQYFFECQPLSNVPITGAILRPDQLYAREAKLQAKYMARWTAKFLRLDADMAMEIPVGDAAYLDANDHFQISAPDLWHDPAAGDPERDGELRIWARDQISGEIIAQLIPMDHPERKTRMGGLTIQGAYPPEIVFAPCSGRLVHNEFGFALRPDASGACDR